uniref:Mei2-like C-terminal RNA recognition motif domain-containing protein n=1 Tax=Aegilops tauschii subsp. strangulata TaxID=200361 RepID=A0A453S357_AEGTS
GDDGGHEERADQRAVAERGERDAGEGVGQAQRGEELLERQTTKASQGNKQPMKGYAFVNLTTADAARGLHYALHGRGWNRSLGSGKIINIGAAYIQGRQRLVRHFSRSTFACHTDEYLPAVFSPPRDGATVPPPGRA